VQTDDRKKHISSLEKDQNKRDLKLSHNEKEIKQLGFNVKTLKAELAEETASRDKVIEDDTKGLRKEVNQLNKEIISLGKDYERQIELLKKDLQTKSEEDASLIKFLNEEMAALTEDLEDREQQLVMYDKDLAKLKEKKSLIKSLNNINEDLSSKLQKKNDQLAKLENSIVGLNENLTKTKLSHSEKIKFAKLSLGEKISKLNDELVSVSRKYIEEINTLKAKDHDITKQLKNQLSENESLRKS